MSTEQSTPEDVLRAISRAAQRVRDAADSGLATIDQQCGWLRQKIAAPGKTYANEIVAMATLLDVPTWGDARDDIREIAHRCLVAIEELLLRPKRDSMPGLAQMAYSDAIRSFAKQLGVQKPNVVSSAGAYVIPCRDAIEKLKTQVEWARKEVERLGRERDDASHERDVFCERADGMKEQLADARAKLARARAALGEDPEGL